MNIDPSHFDAINRLLLSTEKDQSLLCSELAMRKDLVAALNTVLSDKKSGAMATLSYPDGCELKSSIINISLSCGSSEPGGKTRSLFRRVIEDSGLLQNMQTIRGGFWAYRGRTGQPCLIRFSSADERQLVQFFAEFAAVDSRCRTLAVCLMYWSKLCSIDVVDAGTVPKIFYYLILINYLQKSDVAVLPQVKELNGGWRTKNTESVRKLWMGLLKFYAGLGDAFSSHVRSAVFSTLPDALAALTDKRSKYIQDCFQRTHSYFSTPRLKNGLMTSSASDVRSHIISRLQENYHHCSGVGATAIEFNFDFASKDFSKSGISHLQRTASLCGCLEKIEHLKGKCPKAFPELLDLPSLPEYYLRKLNDVCLDLIDKLVITEAEVGARSYAFTVVHSCVKACLPRSRLEMFGSSATGFGLRDSDMDLSVSFSDNREVLSWNRLKILMNKLAVTLRRSEFKSVDVIRWAKVPIIKFTHRSGVEGDISFTNFLAMENTRLLWCYGLVDRRVKPLVVLLKHFAKFFGILGADHGAFSSYAYTLMVIYFLQRCLPPVLPVLQELYDPYKGKQRNMVEGWDTSFYCDIDNLGTVWPGLGRNGDCVGSLWLGLLRFYSEVFDFEEFVISIRQLAPLAKRGKDWGGKKRQPGKIISIEDAFDLTRDLCLGASPKMHVKILTALVKGRDVFGTLPDLPGGNKSLEILEERVTAAFNDLNAAEAGNAQPPIANRDRGLKRKAPDQLQYHPKRANKMKHNKVVRTPGHAPGRRKTKKRWEDLVTK